MAATVADRIRAEARRFGSIGFDRYMELALYGPDGFFARGRGAGRAGRDFLTSPEIGPLFGTCVARALDAEWRTLGCPDPFVVVEAGAGNGRLCREVLRADPACTAALRYVLVETSPALRFDQRERLPVEPPASLVGAHLPASGDDPAESVAGGGPIVTQLSELPATSFAGVVLANELFDNLPFALAEFDGVDWFELRVDESLAFVRAPLDHADRAAVRPFGTPRNGARVPLPRAVHTWFADARSALARGAVIAIDYAAGADEIVARGTDWLRTYREHERGNDALATPGALDITADVVLEHVAVAAHDAGFATASTARQAAWLRQHGIDELVAEGDRIWAERAAIGDVTALEARSRRTQAAALTDQTHPGSLGNFTVWRFTFPS